MKTGSPRIYIARTGNPLSPEPFVSCAKALQTYEKRIYMLNTLTFPFPGVVLVVNGSRDRHCLSYLLLKGLKSSSAMVNFTDQFDCEQPNFLV